MGRGIKSRATLKEGLMFIQERGPEDEGEEERWESFTHEEHLSPVVNASFTREPVDPKNHTLMDSAFQTSWGL